MASGIQRLSADSHKVADFVRRITMQQVLRKGHSLTHTARRLIKEDVIKQAARAFPGLDINPDSIRIEINTAGTMGVSIDKKSLIVKPVQEIASEAVAETAEVAGDNADEGRGDSDLGDSTES